MTQVFFSVAEMKKTRLSVPHAMVMLAGYYAPQDGGGGTFYWDAEETANEDGGTVFAPHGAAKGRYVRLRESHHSNVKWFGAKADGITDDTAAIQAAIDALPDTGGTVTMPGGHYALSAPLQLGDGNGTRPSRKNGIRLAGAGSGIGHQTLAQTDLVAIQPMAVMVQINGPIADCRLERFSLKAKGLAETGITMTALHGGVIERVHVWQQTAVGMAINGGCSHLRFVQSGSANQREKVASLRIGEADKSGEPVHDCTFIGCRFDTAQCNEGVAVWLRYAERLTFMRCHFNVYRFETAKGLLLDAVGHNGYPRGISYYDCSITRGYINEDKTDRIGYHFFMGNGTYDHETIESNPHVFGITDIGSLMGNG